jgi:hypothetical protein
MPATTAEHTHRAIASMIGALTLVLATPVIFVVARPLESILLLQNFAPAWEAFLPIPLAAVLLLMGPTFVPQRMLLIRVSVVVLLLMMLRVAMNAAGFNNPYPATILRQDLMWMAIEWASRAGLCGSLVTCWYVLQRGLNGSSFASIVLPWWVSAVGGLCLSVFLIGGDPLWDRLYTLGYSYYPAQVPGTPNPPTPNALAAFAMYDAGGRVVLTGWLCGLCVGAVLFAARTIEPLRRR